MERCESCGRSKRLYSKEKAKAQFEKAKAELQKEGVQFPIHIDYVVDQSSNALVQQADSMKSSIETALGKDNVVIDVQKLSTDDADNATYFAQSPDKKTLIWISLVGDLTSKTHQLTWISSIPVDGSALAGMGINPSTDQALIEN